MKIVHIASGDLWAGAETQLFFLATAQNRLPDIYVHVFLLNYGELYLRLKNSGVNVDVFDESKLSFLNILYKIILASIKFQPNIIHTHRTKENILGGIAALFAGCVSVRTVHGAAEHLISKLDIRRNILSRLDKFVARYLQKELICVSPELKTKISPSYNKCNLTVIENGIDTDAIRARAKFKDAEIYINKNTFNVAFIGRITPVKRLDIFFLMAIHILNEDNLTNIHFYIFGEGPDLGKLVQNFNVEHYNKNIHVMGFKDNIPAYLSHMNTVVMTSDHEGLPMTLLEAMCLNVTVIASSVGGIPHLLGNGKYGILISNQDANSYREALLDVFYRGSQYHELPEKAAKHIEGSYSIKNKCLEYIDHYSVYV